MTTSNFQTTKYPIVTTMQKDDIYIFFIQNRCDCGAFTDSIGVSLSDNIDDASIMELIEGEFASQILFLENAALKDFLFVDCDE